MSKKTTVRHETVHYTAEEAAAVEALRVKQAKIKWGVIAAIVGALVFGCIACMIIGNLADSELPAAPATENAPARVEPTPRPAATTETAVPTEVSTGTSAPTPDPEEVEASIYIAAITEAVTTYENASNVLTSLANRAAVDPYLMIDEDWKLATAMCLASFTIAGEMIQEINPPVQYVQLHEQLVEAVAHYDRFVELYAAGIDDLDANLVDAAVTELEQGNAAMWHATALLEAALSTE